MSEQRPTPAATGLTPEDRQRLRLVHHRLRNASQAIESLLATEQLKGRWAPAEAIAGAMGEWEQAYQAVVDCHRQLGI